MRRRMFLVLITSLLLVGLLAACGSSSTPTATTAPATTTATETAAAATETPTEATETATPEATATETATPAETATEVATATEAAGSGDLTDISDLTAKIQAAQKDLKSFHFTLEMSTDISGTEMLFSGEGDSVLPDKTRMKMNAFGMDTEVVTIGNDTYTKVGDQWTKQTSAATQQETDPTKIMGEMNFPTEAKRLADETVDGIDCYHLQFPTGFLPQELEDSGLQGDMKADVWIAKDTNFLHKMTFSFELGGEQPGKTTMTMVISNYNEDISIEAPI